VRRTASAAHAIFSRHSSYDEGRFHADVKGRLARYGRTPNQLLILPAATFVLGDTEPEAAEKAYHVAGSRSAARPRSSSSNSCGTGLSFSDWQGETGRGERPRESTMDRKCDPADTGRIRRYGCGMRRVHLIRRIFVDLGRVISSSCRG
jgi:alkanesulfonate monooxygenase SsuD/methylene tetrahydromethanopterin reductase-like flavin-dependent oxidoreductase (luciferase family)